MTQERWTAVDGYLTDLFIPADPVLDGALRAATAASLPAINVSPPQGKLLHLIARLQRARTILEIGTLAGYSTIWLARALPSDGRLISLEVDARHAKVAQANIAAAGLSGLVDIRLGPALDTLPKLATEGCGPFDLIFIDADKPNTPEYFAWAVTLARRGSVIIVDNVVRDGAIVDASSADRDVQGMRRFTEIAAANPRVTMTAIQTVGSKGYDGFVIALVTEGS